ncbi:MAG: hypothetical protein WCD68_04900, partial [Candidatus Acidiferrum sp.]
QGGRAEKSGAPTFPLLHERGDRAKNRPEGRPLQVKEKPRSTGKSACATNAGERTGLKTGHYKGEEKSKSRLEMS